MLQVDRRDNEATWLAAQNALTPHSSMVVSDRHIVPFLPANPEFSATRNQVSGTSTRFYPPTLSSLPLATK